MNATNPASPRAALAALSLATLLASLGTSIAPVALPILGRTFDASMHAVQAVVIAYLAAMTALLVPAGRLADRRGRRFALLTGLGVFTGGSLLAAAAPNLLWLVIARMLQGTGAAAMVSVSVALGGEIASKGRLGSAMGLLGTMSAVGTALGPALGGLLIAVSGWRALFLVNAPLGVAAVALAVRHLPQDRLISGWPQRAGGISPWREPALRPGLAMTALVAAVMMATLVVGPFHLAIAVGLEPAHVGLAMAMGPIAAALAGAPAGRLVDHIGATRATRMGLAAMLAGAVGLALAWSALGIAGYVVPLVIVTAGYALFQAANNTAVMARVERERRGAVSGLLNLSRNLGLIAGAALLGAFFAWAADGSLGDAAAVRSATRATFGLGVTLVLAALVFARR